MFKKNEVIMYPAHGKTVINRVYKETNGEEYYELLYGKNLTVLIPTEKSEMLGLRYPIEKNSLLQLLKDSKKMQFEEEDLVNTAKVIGPRFSTGKVDDLIYIIKLMKSLSKSKQEKNKKLEISERQHLSNARELLYSEMEYVLGESYKDLRI